MKPVFVCVITLLAATARRPVPQKDPFVLAIDIIKKSIAPVVCAERGTPDWVLKSMEGTAFFIDPDGEFVTPNHVIEALTGPNRTTPCAVPAVYVPQGGWAAADKATFRVTYRAFDIAACRTDKDIDVAVCKPLEKISGISPVSFDAAFQPDGTPVAFTGFPLSNTEPISAIASIAGHADVRDYGPLTLIIDKNNWPGASGSPIFLKSGKVVGMITKRGIGDATGLAYGNTIQYVAKFIATK